MTKNPKKNDFLPRSDLGRNEINFAFFGTPKLATVILDALEEAGYLPALVVTAPDQKKGRGLAIQSSPVKVWSQIKGIEVLQPERLDSEFGSKLLAVGRKFDLFIVIYYGKVLPKEILDIPARGTLNIHFSLLPRWRGTSPVRAAILNDDREIGTSIILLDEKIDHGPVIAQKKLSPPAGGWPPRARELEALATCESARLLIEILPSWIAGEIEAHDQNHDVATYCSTITKEDGLISLSGDAYKNLLKIRAFDTTVGTYTYFERNEKKIRVGILDAHIDPSTPLGARKLVIDKVKPEGKKEMAYEEFLRSGARPVK